MANHMVDLTGQRFGRLTAIAPAGKNKSGNYMWECVCDCGTRTVVASGGLRSGTIVSCGCYIREVTSKRSKTHGETGTRLYKIWIGMKNRCHNPEADNYKDYGGRGIAVCEEWRHSYLTFSTWAKQNGYADNLSIDRIDNDKGYSPDNCRWVNRFVQGNNKRSNAVFTIDGETKTVTQWARIYGINPITVFSRLYKGMDIVEALTKSTERRTAQ